jgi:cell division protein FtsW
MIISQVLLNIAVVAGALPATGVTLPFFSAGGSSLATTLIMAGLVVNVSRFNQNKVHKKIYIDKPGLDKEIS